MWAEVYKYLKENKIDVYSMGQKNIPDTKAHVVLKQGVSNAFVGSNHTGFSTLVLVVYFPADKYSQMFDYTKRVKQLMVELNEKTGKTSNALRFTGNETPHVLEDASKMVTTMIEYQILKSL